MIYGSIVKIEKLSDGGSLPRGYIVRGQLMCDLQPGDPIQMLRFQRNEVPILGYFVTSEITKMEYINHEMLMVTTATGSRYSVVDAEEII